MCMKMYTLPPLYYTSVTYSLVYKVIIVDYVLVYWWCIQSGAVHIVSHRNEYLCNIPGNTNVSEKTKLYAHP